MRVLIADDDTVFAAVLAELVRNCQHEVVDVVNSGLAAIRSYHRNKPDVVLMDFNMAKLNGLTACRNILSNDPSGRVVFLSGMSTEDLSPACSGAVAVLSKPIWTQQLGEVLDRVARATSKNFQIVLKSSSTSVP